MSRKEIETGSKDADKKLRVKDLIYAGAFGAIYLVLMLVIVMGSGIIPILYLFSPLTVGVVCGTVFHLYVLKVHKFGAVTILGVLFALVVGQNFLPGLIAAIVIGVISDIILTIGKFKSRIIYMISFIVFNLNMVCPFSLLFFNRERFLSLVSAYHGQAYYEKLSNLTPSWIFFVLIGLALLGGLLGSLIARKLAKKHFNQVGIL